MCIRDRVLRDFTENNNHGRHTALQFGEPGERPELVIEDSVYSYAVMDEKRTLCSVYMGGCLLYTSPSPRDS